MPGPAADRAAAGQHGRAGELIAAGDQPEYAAAVLVRLSARPRQDCGDVGGLQRHNVGRAQIRAQPDVDQLGCPGEASAGVDQQAGLDGSEGHGDVSGDGGAVHLAGVSVNAAWQIDRDDESAVAAGLRDQLGQRRAGFAQAAVAADAGKSVDDQVRGRDRWPDGRCSPAASPGVAAHHPAAAGR